MKTLSLILFFFAFFPLAGHASEGHEKIPKQLTCPVMLGEPIDPTLFVDYEGERIYLCCKTCRYLFSETPETYVKKLPQPSAADDTHVKEEVAHDHEADHPASTGFAKLISFLGKFHPLSVHLPIGLILAAALAELLFLFTGTPLFRNAARFNLLIAVLGVVVAIPLGLAAASGTHYPDDYSAILFRHKLLGFTTLGGITLTAALSEWLHRKGTGTCRYRTALGLSVLIVGATGHLGGLLVFGMNHFSW